MGSHHESCPALLLTHVLLRLCAVYLATHSAPPWQVRFYDGVLRLCAWFEELRAGPVASVTFSTAGDSNPEAASKLNR